MSTFKYFDYTFESKSFNLRVYTQINNSESEINVMKALKNIFPALKFIKKENQIQGQSNNISDLYNFCLLLNNQKILDAARNYVLSHMINKKKKSPDLDQITILINKQIAFYNKISFCSENESPLGPIKLEILLDSSDLDIFIDKFFPKFERISN